MSSQHRALPLSPGSTVWLVGRRSLAGAAIWQLLTTARSLHLVDTEADGVDLRDGRAVLAWAAAASPDVVVLADLPRRVRAAEPVRSVAALADTLRAQTAVLSAALALGVPRLLFVGSGRVYGQGADQPVREEHLDIPAVAAGLDAEAAATASALEQVRVARQDHGLAWVAVTAADLYGPGADSTLETGPSAPEEFAGQRVVATLISRFHRASRREHDEIMLASDRRPQRDLLHVGDLARACLHLLGTYDDDLHLNVGTGVAVTLEQVAEAVADATAFTGQITWWAPASADMTYRTLDVSRLRSTGFQAAIGLRGGIATTYAGFLARRAARV